MVAQLPGESIEYKLLDSVLDESQAVHFPIQFLNSLEVSGFPSHMLFLKISAPIIILRSLDPPKVTNGTRHKITKLSANSIEARISHGRYAGHDIIIPCDPLTQHCRLNLHTSVSSCTLFCDDNKQKLRPNF